MRSPLELIAPYGPKNVGSGDVERRHVAALQRLPPQSDGVDLVDEDDALAAPFAREALRLAREEAHDERVDADERLREARARDGDERRVEAVAIAFASIVLPVPGAPRKSRPRSRLPPAASNASPDCQRVTMRRTSSFASTWPRTSSSLTPHSASPGS